MLDYKEFCGMIHQDEEHGEKNYDILIVMTPLSQLYSQFFLKVMIIRFNYASNLKSSILFQ